MHLISSVAGFYKLMMMLIHNITVNFIAISPSSFKMVTQHSHDAVLIRNSSKLSTKTYNHCRSMRRSSQIMHCAVEY